MTEFKRPPIIHAGAVDIFLDDMGTRYEEEIRKYLKEVPKRRQSEIAQ